ncbi:MAG: hypothetical protein AAF297_09740 [Planctomycetota bacterium]
MTSCAIIATGVANTASVAAALRRIGLSPTVTAHPAEVEAADLAVLPGVGSFAVGMAMLINTRNDRVITERINQGRPLLAVCLGMQLLGTASEESPGVPGLAIVPHAITAFPKGTRTPQFGWNKVSNSSPVADGGGGREADGVGLSHQVSRSEAPPVSPMSPQRKQGTSSLSSDPPLLQPGHAYFANSYRYTDAPQGWHTATADHGGPFIAAMARGNTLACQFHPELSGPFGLDLIRRWAERCGVRTTAMNGEPTPC